MWKVARIGDESGDVFAAKVFRDGYSWDCHEEIKQLRPLNHPRIPKLIDTFESTVHNCVIVEQLLQGPTLKEFIEPSAGSYIPRD